MRLSLFLTTILYIVATQIAFAGDVEITGECAVKVGDPIQWTIACGGTIHWNVPCEIKHFVLDQSKTLVMGSDTKGDYIISVVVEAQDGELHCGAKKLNVSEATTAANEIDYEKQIVIWWKNDKGCKEDRELVFNSRWENVIGEGHNVHNICFTAKDEEDGDTCVIDKLNLKNDVDDKSLPYVIVQSRATGELWGKFPLSDIKGETVEKRSKALADRVKNIGPPTCPKS